jgi:hypothetical protein
MAADFKCVRFEDRDKALYPYRAVPELQRSPHRGLRPALCELFKIADDKNLGAWANLSSNLRDNSAAVLMNGEVSDLQKALQQAEAAGTQGFWSTGDQLVVWHIRRQAGSGIGGSGIGAKDKSVLLIMPLLSFLRPRGKPGAYITDPRQIVGTQDWQTLFATSDNATDPAYKGLTLAYLSSLLDGVDGADPWYYE